MNLSVPDINLSIISPALIVAVTAIIVLLGELVTPPQRKRWLGYLSIAGLVVAAYAAFSLWGTNASGFSGMVAADNFGLFLTLTIALGAALTILLSIPYIHAHKIDQGEYYVLLLGSVAGMILMATATDLIVIFLGLELLSLPLYILAAFERENTKSLEAAIKYILLGAFSSAFFLYGIALVFGATGTTNLAKIVAALSAANAGSPMLNIGIGLLIVGFAF